MTFQNVPLSQIAMDRAYFQVESPPVKPVSCIPPWLVLQEEKYYILDGFAEIQQAKTKNQDSSITAQVLTGSPLALWEQLIFRKSSLEQLTASFFLELLYALQVKEEIKLEDPKILAAARKLAFKEKWFQKKNLSFLQENKTTIEAFTEYSQLGGKELQALSLLTVAELSALQDLTFGQKLRGNKLTSLLTLIVELKKGFKITLESLQSDQPLWNQMQELPYHLLKLKLEEMRYPRLTAQKKLLQIAEKKLPKNVSLDVNPNFEADTCKIVLEISSDAEFATQLKALQKIQQEKALEPIFQLIF